MSEKIEVGSMVQVPSGADRPRTIVMRVARIEGDRAWLERLGRQEALLEMPLADLKLDKPRGPLRIMF